MSTRKISTYVDAVYGLRALQHAEADEGKTPERTAAIAAARGRGTSAHLGLLLQRARAARRARDALRLGSTRHGLAPVPCLAPKWARVAAFCYGRAQ